MSAIVAAALHVSGQGFAAFKQAVLAAPLTELRRLPYIGPVTVWHLAKNLGLDVAKSDRHLARISLAFGFDDANHFCSAISRAIGERRKVVDLIVSHISRITDAPRNVGAPPTTANRPDPEIRDSVNNRTLKQLSPETP